MGSSSLSEDTFLPESIADGQLVWPEYVSVIKHCPLRAIQLIAQNLLQVLVTNIHIPENVTSRDRHL